CSRDYYRLRGYYFDYW
nr:immunoglobulin heavy chain junction region [Mus musculus]